MNSLHHVINLVRRLRGTGPMFLEGPVEVKKDDFFPITVLALAVHPEQQLLYIMAQDFEWYAISETITDGVIVTTLREHLDSHPELYETKEAAAI